MKKKNLLFLLSIYCILFAIACNKEKRLMNNLIGNWKIELSEKLALRPDGTDSLLESVTNAGKLVIYEDPNHPSDESKLYDLFFIDASQDTLSAQGVLYTDSEKSRIVLKKALNNSTSNSDIVFSIEKEKKKKQVWSAYGVDSTLFYSSNHHNPGNADFWLTWRITLKREK